MKKEILIGICDDDVKIKETIIKKCEKYSQRENSFTYVYFYSGKDLLNYTKDISASVIDLLFLDIEMPDLDGLQVLETIKKETKVWRVSFVTNHAENILETFSIRTIGFIPKPISDMNFARVMDRFLSEYQANKEIVVIGDDQKRRKIKDEDIIYLKAEGSYTEIYAKDNTSVKRYLISRKLGEIEKYLGDIFFIRVHKSFIVNAEYIDSIGNEIYLNETGIVIPIGRKYKKQLNERIRLYKLMRIENRI